MGIKSAENNDGGLDKYHLDTLAQRVPYLKVVKRGGPSRESVSAEKSRLQTRGHCISDNKNLDPCNVISPILTR